MAECNYDLCCLCLRQAELLQRRHECLKRLPQSHNLHKAEEPQHTPRTRHAKDARGAVRHVRKQDDDEVRHQPENNCRTQTMAVYIIK